MEWAAPHPASSELMLPRASCREQLLERKPAFSSRGRCGEGCLLVGRGQPAPGRAEEPYCGCEDLREVQAGGEGLPLGTHCCFQGVAIHGVSIPAWLALALGSWEFWEGLAKAPPGGAAHSEGVLPSAQGPATSQEGLSGGLGEWQLGFRREPWTKAPEYVAGPVER